MRTRWFNALTLLVLLLGMVSPQTALAGPAKVPPVTVPSSLDAQETSPAEIEQGLLDQLTVEDSADFVVVMAEQADLSAAYRVSDWHDRGRYVYDTLRKVAERTQAPVLAYAKRHGLAYQAFFTTNSVHIQRGTLRAAQDIALMPGVMIIRAPKVMQVDKAALEAQQAQATTSFGWNLDALEPDSGLYGMQAAQVWNQYGVRGNGIVVANIDTGVTYQHEALNRQYRGNLGSSYEHDFSWYAPTSDAAAQCGGDAATSPCDSDGHGSGTAGIMVGETADLTEQLGVAPAAEWIACMGCDLYGPGGAGGCSEAALTGCADWMVAPCPIGADPGDPSCDPDMRPNIVNNSWGGTGGDDWYRGYIQAWTAAGIFPAFSAGNTVGCAAVGSPGDNPEAFGTAAHNSTGQNLYAGGPSVFFPNPSCDPDAHEVDPHLNAPTYGRTASEVPGGYYNIGGTSGASPHTAGAVALIWSANPALIGDIDTTFTLLEQSADRSSTQPWREGTCDKPACAGADPYPNYCYGWGYLDALAAVDEAMAMADNGILAGTITETGTGTPIADAQVMATLSVTRSWQTTTDARGEYAIAVFSGAYTVDAWKYGYLPVQVTGVDVTTDMTTTLDLELPQATYYTVDGTVTDANTGWPLYAQIDIAGYPASPVWTDPETGAYSVDLAEGVDYVFTVSAWVDGYESASRSVSALTADRTEDFALDAEASCTAPGYAFVDGVFQSFEGSFPPAAWTVVNNGGQCTWVGNDPGGRGNMTGGAGAFAIADSDACGMGTTMNTDLLSPVIDVSDLTSVTLAFSYDYNNLATSELAAVDVSADGGTTWDNVVTWNTDQRGPARFSADVTGLLGGSTEAQVRFRYVSPGWYWWWEVDDFMLGFPVCMPPTDGGLVVGNVYDVNLGSPLAGAEVTNDTGGMVTTVATADPAVDDAFYTLFSPSGTHTFTASKDGFVGDVADVAVANGGTVTQDFALGAGYIDATPDGVEVTLQAGANSKQSLSLENIGVLGAAFTLIEVPGGYLPLSPTAAMGIPVHDGERRIELTASGVEGDLLDAEPWAPTGPIELILDDGSAEDAIGLTSGGQFIWLNRFTPDPSDYPFTLDQVWMLFRDSANLGEAIELVIWEDTDGDGDPGTGANVRSVEYVTVQANDNATWSVYGLSSPVFFSGPGDVLIGAVNRDATGAYPAAIDTTASQGRSWVGIYSGNPPEPPTLPPDADWGVIDSMGFPGNWMIRGSGATGLGGDAIPWLTESPISGTVAAGDSQSVMLTLDAGVPEANQPGTYYGALQVQTDTPYPHATVPVTMNVLPPASWGKVMGTVTSLGYCDLESNQLLPGEGEVTITSNTGAMWTVFTDEDGMYSLWLDAMYGPVTITVAVPEHVTGVETDVVITGGMTTTVDFGLRWLAPCVTAEPVPLEQTVTMGYSTTVPFTITNWGAGGTPFTFAEVNGSFTIAAPAVNAPAPLGTPNPAWVESGEATGEPVIGTPSGGPAPEDIGLAWETMAPAPSPRVFNAVIADTDGYVYVIGGTSDAAGLTPTNTTFRYNTATNSWDTMAPMPASLMSIDGAVINGRIYIPGDGTTANTYVYDIATNAWSTLATTGGYTAREQYQAVAIETDLYVLGGIVTSLGASTTEVWILDTTTGAWSAGVPMQHSRTSFSAGVIDDEIYVAGGVLFPGFTPDMTAEKFDGTAWSHIADLPNGGGAYTRWSYNADAVGVDGLWLGAGRRDADWNVLNHAGYYDPDADTWTDSPTIPTLAQGRVYMEGDVAADGYFYVIGGRDSAGAVVYATNERLEVGYAGGGGGGAIPWLAEDPEFGTVAADSTYVVDVTFDAGAAITQVMQPGKYFGTLHLSTEDPVMSSRAIPVTMTVAAPATWGKVMGTVTSLGYCDAESSPVEDAEVLIEATGGTTWTLLTDAMGVYALWIDEMYSPLTITVTATEHATGEATGVVVAAGVTTTQDFDLRWLVPCVSPDPDALAVTLDMGDTTSVELSVENDGAVDADWALSEAARDPGFVPIAPSAGEDVLVVAYDTAAANAMEAALTVDGYTYLRVDRTTFEGMPVADLLTYGAVFYAGGYSGDSWAKAMVYLDAGGSFLIADNDFGYGNRSTAFYQVYLQATYVSDAGSDGVLTGTDIMAGVNPDISPDPYPDDFTISGPDAVGIFVAPSTNWAGLRIARAGYRAIYLAWDFDDIASTADETTIVDRAVDWLGFSGDDVPWMAEDPTSGTVGAYSSDTVDVTFDASVPEVAQPGDYLAWINVDAPDDPVMGGFAVPVTMTVNPPATWARLDGTVYSLGYCDSEMNPVDGAEVLIENGVDVTLSTGADGMYSYWLAPGTYTVTVSAPEHTVGEAVVTISAGVSQTQDFNLRWLVPCIAVSPDAIGDTLALGDSADHALTIHNGGAGDATFSFLEYYEGYAMPATVVASAPAGSMRLVTIGDNALTANPNATREVGVVAPAQARPENIYALTHSLSQNVMSGNSVACGAGGLHTDNSYIRVFDLASFGVTDYFDVQQVEVGIETAAAGTGGVQPGVINLYTLSGPLAWANMTLIGSAGVDVADQSLTVISVPVTGTVPAGSVLVVEFFTPNGQVAGNSLYVGSNNLGQTAPTYLAAADCGVPEPTDTAAIGFPGMHLVMNVIGYTPEAVDLPWLYQTPLTGIALSDDTTDVTVTLDADLVPMPGVYHATMVVDTDDPVNPRHPVAVAITVTLPSNYGKIEGTVYSTGYCDAEMNPVAGADVVIKGSDGVTVAVTTDLSGMYEVWRDETTGPYTVTATAPEHWDGVATGVIVTGTETTVQDFELRWMQPCVGVAPAELTAEVALGMSTTTYITVANTGGYDLNWSLVEGEAGFALLAANNHILVVNDGSTAAATAFETALTSLGYTWDEVTSSTFVGMDIGTIMADYAGVIYAGAPSSGSEHTQVIAYLDAGGRFLVADNDFGYFYGGGSYPVYTTYLQAAYGTDSGSDGVLTGVDIMAGENPDISGDPYPDDFTIIGPDAVGIFIAPSANWAGLRIERLDYKAIYFAWDYEHTPTPLSVLEKAMTWLIKADVTWLSEDPQDGTTAMDSTSTVTVTFDAGVPEVTQPGDYTTTLTIESNDPMYQEVVLPVTMTVTAPATWGKLAGTVMGLGYCDADPAPIEDAVIFIESGMGMTWTVSTDASGTYGIWFDEMVSPVTVTVSYEAGYEAQTFTGVAVVGGEVTTLDVDLRWLQPCVSTDAAVDVTLQMGTTGTYMLNLANNGALSTTYTLVEQDLGYTIAGSQAVADLFGYAVADSGDPLGPDYDFVDITAFGAPLALGDDDFAGPVPLGFDLDFYGNDCNEVYINSNGFLSFGSGSTDMSNDVLPNVQTPNNIIALMWDDLVGGTAYVYTFDMCPYASGQCTVVQYEGFTHMGGADAGTWQVILFRNGNILMQFEDAGDNAGAASTTGIENRYGTDGITYAANVPALEDELAVCFAYPGNSTDCVPSDVVWMDEDPVLGDILADDVTPVTLSFDASIPETSQPGVYMAALHLTTGDPYNGVQVIPVTMTVEAPATWAKIVGTVLAWDHCDTTSRVMPGATVLIESANSTDSWAFTTDAEGTYDLWLDEAHSPVVVTVSAEGYVTTVDVVAFDDGDTVNPVHDLRMDAPCFTMDTYAIEFAVTKGHTHTEQLMMTNQGAGMLEITDVAGDGWMTPGMTSGKINPGESYPLDVVFSAAGMSLGDHVGTLQIANNDPMMPMMTVPVTMTVLMPTVEVDVYATPPDVTHPGEVITYTIVVTNTSDGALDVDLTTAIPMHTAYIAGSQTGGLVYAQPPTGDAQMTWSGTLAPMVPQTFTFAVQVDAGVTGGTIDILTEVATEDAVYEDTESLTVTVVTPTIEVDVYATPPDVTHPGDVITYTIMVTNTGDDALAADLTAAIPMHTAYILGSQTGGLAYVDPPAGDAHMAWSGTLAPMAPQTFTFAVQVDAGVTGGTIDILAEVAVDDLVYDDTASVLVELYRIMLPIISKN